MGSVRTRKETGLLFLDFRYKGRRSREQTSLPDTAENRKRLAKALRRIEQQIADGTFDYRSTFPAPSEKDDAAAEANATARQAAKTVRPSALPASATDSPSFRTFIEQWVREHTVEWRRSHLRTLRSTIDSHLLPAFGERPVGAITREEITDLPQRAGRQGRA